MQSMSQVTAIAAVPSATALIRGYAIRAFGVSWRPGHFAITPPCTARAASLTGGRLVFGVASV